MPLEFPAVRRSELLTFLARHMVFGLAMGIIFASLILLLNVAGLSDLIRTSSEPHIALILLFAFNALTFGSVAMGIGVMTLPFDRICDMRDPERPRDRDDQRS